MEKVRIAVTGLGVVSALGNEVDVFYKGLLAGRSAARLITGFPCNDYPTRFAAEIEKDSNGKIDAEGLIDDKQKRRVDLSILYAFIAGKKALRHARLGSAEERRPFDAGRCGIVIGSGMGGMSAFYDGVQALLEKGHRRVSPFFVPYIIPNMSGALLAIDVGFRGPNYSVSTACATASHSIISAANHIRRGEADIMLCGGVEAAVHPIGLAGFCSCKAVSQRNDDPQRASRPWDKQRDGFVLGEGAGILVLENMEHAKARGATLLAEYLGGGMNCDAFHMTDPCPDGSGVAECVRKALADAGVHADAIGYINAHATSTLVGDVAELRALKLLFPSAFKRQSIAINATKSLIGHALGAAGGLEAVATVESLRTQCVHPTLNLEEPEEELDFFAPKAVTPHAMEIAVSNSFGFGGHNACLVFGAV